MVTENSINPVNFNILQRNLFRVTSAIFLFQILLYSALLFAAYISVRHVIAIPPAQWDTNTVIIYFLLGLLGLHVLEDVVCILDGCDMLRSEIRRLTYAYASHRLQDRRPLPDRVAAWIVQKSRLSTPD